MEFIFCADTFLSLLLFKALFFPLHLLGDLMYSMLPQVLLVMQTKVYEQEHGTESRCLRVLQGGWELPRLLYVWCRCVWSCCPSFGFAGTRSSYGGGMAAPPAPGSL